MPELAEVEYYRQQWQGGVGEEIQAVKLHPQKRIFRGTNTRFLQQTLPGTRLLGSEGHGKQMLFRFSNGLWLGLHLGMTGKLHVQRADLEPGKHDHLVLYQRKRTLVFTDARQFGRVKFHQGTNAPRWWSSLPPVLDSKEFTPAVMQNFLRRHGRLPIKAALLLQNGFPGVGNWMADEILWQAGINPHTLAGELKPGALRELWRKLRFVCREAMRKISPDFSEPPSGWLFHERWQRQGKCPHNGTALVRETIRGRTTAWCPKCQKAP